VWSVNLDKAHEARSKTLERWYWGTGFHLTGDPLFGLWSRLLNVLTIMAEVVSPDVTALVQGHARKRPTAGKGGQRRQWVGPRRKPYYSS
jgi:hypothetical protein